MSCVCNCTFCLLLALCSRFVTHVALCLLPCLQVDFLPFDPTIKRTEGTLKGPDGKIFKCTKGAPHIILKLVDIDQEEVAKRVNWKVRQPAGNVLALHTRLIQQRHLQQQRRPVLWWC